jgi:hypothetical protein
VAAIRKQPEPFAADLNKLGTWLELHVRHEARVLFQLIEMRPACRRHERKRRSIQHFPWALRWYHASATFLALGALLGILRARESSWPYGSLLGAHLALNLGGWLGTAIIGTLHTFLPSLTQTRLRFPRLQGPTFVVWLIGITEFAAGSALGSGQAIAIGWLDLLCAATLLTINIAGSLLLAPRPLALPARLLAVGQLFLTAGLGLGLAVTLHGGLAGPDAARAALAALLLAGWIGLTVAGSLLHLLALLARIKRFSFSMREPHPRRDQTLALAAGAGIATLALAHAPGLASLMLPATAVLLATAGVLAIRVLVLATRAVHPRAS